MMKLSLDDGDFVLTAECSIDTALQITRKNTNLSNVIGTRWNMYIVSYRKDKAYFRIEGAVKFHSSQIFRFRDRVL